MQPQAPQQQQAQQPSTTNPSAASLANLKAALAAASKVTLVTPEENAAKIKAMKAQAKELLDALRGVDEPDPVGAEDPTQEPQANAVPQFGMGPRAFAANDGVVTPDEQRQIDLATEQFKQSVQRVDNQILAQYVQAVQDGDYAKAEAILKNAEDSQQTHTLMFALLTIGAILLPLYAKQRLQNLYLQFGMHTVFAQTKSGQDAMKLQAQRGAKSHVQTIAKDIKNNLDDAIDSEIENPTIEAAVKDRFPDIADKDGKQYVKAVHGNEEIYAYARQQILAGDSRQSVIQKLQQNFSDVSKRRANVIAGNEANRVFTMSQFDADKQFLAQNKLTDRAYKRLVSNTGHPEAICRAIIDATAANPIPFKNDFIPFGKTFSVKDGQKTYKIKPTYEKLQSGHIHVNCHCRYELLIKQDDGSFFNTYDGKVVNGIDFNPDLHPRDLTGKFSKKRGIGIPLDLSHVNTKDQFDEMIHQSWLSGAHGHWDEHTTDAVRAYQGHYYDAINIHARANMLDDPLTINGKDSTYGDTINHINGAATLNLATDTTLYRGTEIPYHQVNDVGDEIDARSFISTSVDKHIAKKFQAPGGSFVIISAKKGQKVILPDAVTYGQRGGKTMGEAEVLAPTDSKLKITNIIGDVVYAEMQ